MKNIIFLDTIKKMPIMSLPVRTPLVSLQNAHILISPGSNISIEQYQKLPNITDIVAPNMFHTAGILKAAKQYPKAKIWTVGNFNGDNEIKSRIQNLTEAEWPYQAELPVLKLKGMPKAQECIFFHKESKSIIVTDLCFNMINASGFGAWLILNMFGTYGKLGVSRYFVSFIKDKKEFETSLSQLFKFDFTNIIVSHGENVLNNGKPSLLEALAMRKLKPQPV